MHKFTKAVMAGSVYLLVSLGAHADINDAEAGIRSLMTPEQYKAAGLDKLSAAEREALYQWLQQYAGKPTAQMTATPAPALPAVTVSAITTQAAASTTAPKAVSEPVAPESASVAAQSAAVAATTPPAPAPAAKTQGSDGGPAATAALEKNFGLPDPIDEAEAAYQLRANVQEPFRGWSGKTLFYLDNGQVWKQRTTGRHTYTGDDNRVVISQNQMGFFEMRLIAVDRAVGVKRLK